MLNVDLLKRTWPALMAANVLTGLFGLAVMLSGNWVFVLFALIGTCIGLFFVLRWYTRLAEQDVPDLAPAVDTGV